MERYRISDEAKIYFITYSVVEWLPVFISAASCQIVTDSFQFCQKSKSLRVNAFVIMPTHIHAIVFDAAGDTERLHRSLIEFRKFTGRNLTELVRSSFPRCFEETLKEASLDDRDHRFWQPSRHPVALETEAMWAQKRDYLHENPCRKGLVRRASDWRFSSAAWYMNDMASECDVEIHRLDWS